MTDVNRFLAFLNKALKKELDSHRLTGLEKIGIKVSVYDIFQKNYDLEQTYHELLEYMGEEDILTPLIPKVKEYYLKMYD